MADTMISAFASGAPAVATDTAVFARAGANRRLTVQNLHDFAANRPFPATQVPSADANTLDDYEETTWSATLEGLGTNPTTPVIVTGNAEKTGRGVRFEAVFSNVDTTGATGQIRVTGLPYSASSNHVAPVMTYALATFASGTPIALVTGSAATLYYMASNAAWGNVTHNAGTGRFMNISGNYRST